MAHRHHPNPLTTLLVAASLAACAPLRTLDPDDVLAPDLETAVQALAPEARVDVIVRYAEPVRCTGPDGHEHEGVDSALRLSGAALLRRFPLLPGFAASVTAEGVDRLAGCSGILRVTPDRLLYGATAPASGPADLASRTTGAAAVLAGSADVEATGRGVTIAVLDSGLDARHPALRRRGLLAGALSFLDGADAAPVAARRDAYGHGTLVAGAMVSQAGGAAGLSPEVRLLSLRVLDAAGRGRTSDAIAALGWLVEQADAHGVRVVNVSLGSAVVESYRTDPLCQAVEAAIRHGLVVVASAGNLGRSDGETLYGGVGSPANHPAVITVGAADPQGTVERADDAVAAFSSRGPTLVDGIAKPDLVAPGVGLVLPAASGSTLTRAARHLRVRVPGAGGRWVQASGTSFAAPLVSSAVALMLELNPALGPTEVKAILQLTAQRLEAAHPLEQGAGLLNVTGAAWLAAQWGAGRAPGDANLHAVLDAAPASVIEGEQVLWSNGIIWNGTVLFQLRFLRLLWPVVGWLEGTGIIWNGYQADLGELAWLDYRVSGVDLAGRFQEAWSPGVLWGDGIIWNGRIAYAPSASFGPSAVSRWLGNLASPAAVHLHRDTLGPFGGDGERVGLRADPEEALIVVPDFGPRE